MIRLGVNIDHVATIRQARKTFEPDPVHAASLAELGGADGITIHLREDRRHIADRDLILLRQTVHSHLNLEMAMSDEIVRIAVEQKPDQATLVPENRQEVTTEGGLDVVTNRERVDRVIEKLGGAGILVSLFVDPDPDTIKDCAASGAKAVELHTGTFANAASEEERRTQVTIIAEAAELASSLGLKVFAGHGLTYFNVHHIVDIPEIEELNIGHSIISRAVLVGLERAVADMKALLVR